MPRSASYLATGRYRRAHRLCVDCAAGLQESDGVRCVECAESHRDAAARYQASVKGRRTNRAWQAARYTRLREARLCVGLCGRPAPPDRVRCEECSAEHCARHQRYLDRREADHAA